MMVLGLWDRLPYTATVDVVPRLDPSQQIRGGPNQYENINRISMITLVITESNQVF